MKKWRGTNLRLKDNHGWRARPGYKIFVADQGALRFDYPASWICTPTSESVHFRDKPEPNDDCLIQASVMYLNKEIDWSGLRMRDHVASLASGDPRGLHSPTPTHHEQRGQLEIAWVEHTFTDPNEQRDALNRTCLARQDTTMPLITMVLWPEHRARFDPVWREVLRTLQLNRFIKDPTQGPILH